MAKTVYFGILHPVMGLIGDSGSPYANQSNPGGIKIIPGSLFTEIEHAEAVRSLRYKACEVVPVTISCPEFSFPKNQSALWKAALKYNKAHPLMEFNHGFADWMLVNGIIDDYKSDLWTDFPFSAPFPKTHIGQTYEIILVSGICLKATVDNSMEFELEGLEWKTKQGKKPQSAVVAWKQILPKE